MDITPVIVVVGYNRIESLRRLLSCLEKAIYHDEVTLIISIDYGGPSIIATYAKNFVWSHGNKIVKLHTKNLGLKKHILECGDYSISYGAAIIFEDDIMPSPYFYEYVKQAVNFYKNDKRIFAVSLYSQLWNGYANRVFAPIRNEYDAFISQIECSWGECFIGERWKEFKKWYEKNEEQLLPRKDVPEVVFNWQESYSKYLLYYIVENELYYLTPYESYTTNFHKSGTHAQTASLAYQVPLMYGEKQLVFPEYEKAIMYDAFFESIILKRILEKKFSGAKICVDYYGLHSNYSDYDIGISTAELPYKVIASYGLELRPPELNYIWEIQGKDIFLYDFKCVKKNKKRKRHHYNLIYYDVKDLQWIDSLFYTLYQLWEKMLNKIKSKG